MRCIVQVPLVNLMSSRLPLAACSNMSGRQHEGHTSSTMTWDIPHSPRKWSRFRSRPDLGAARANTMQTHEVRNWQAGSVFGPQPLASCNKCLQAVAARPGHQMHSGRQRPHTQIHRVSEAWEAPPRATQHQSVSHSPPRRRVAPHAQLRRALQPVPKDRTAQRAGTRESDENLKSDLEQVCACLGFSFSTLQHRGRHGRKAARLRNNDRLGAAPILRSEEDRQQPENKPRAHLEVQNVLWNLRGLARTRGALDDAHLTSCPRAERTPGSHHASPTWF